MARCNPVTHHTLPVLGESAYEVFSIGAFEGNTRVNYKFNVSSDRAVDFKVIAEDLSKENPALLVSFNEIKSEADKQQIKQARKELKLAKKDKGISHEAIENLEDDLHHLAYVEREYFILLHDKLARKIELLAGSSVVSIYVEDLINTLKISSKYKPLNILRVRAEDIADTKEALQYVINSSWPLGYKATVEVKSLL